MHAVTHGHLESLIAGITGTETTAGARSTHGWVKHRKTLATHRSMAFALASACSVAWSALMEDASPCDIPCPCMTPMPPPPPAPPPCCCTAPGICGASTCAPGAPIGGPPPPTIPGADRKEMLCEYLQVAPRLQRPRR